MSSSSESDKPDGAVSPATAEESTADVEGGAEGVSDEAATSGSAPAAAGTDQPIGSDDRADGKTSASGDDDGEQEIDVDSLLHDWAAIASQYTQRYQVMEKEEDENRRLQLHEASREADGRTVRGLADRMSEPALDTRVWLHMYPNTEADQELENSFCYRTGDAHYMYDFNSFSDWNVEVNALLSDEAKCLMAKLYSANPSVWTSAQLAATFRIREQRALAIVKIKEREFQQADECTTMLNRLQELLKLPQVPTVEELHRPKFKHSMRHLTGWFEKWLQLYDALPQLVGGAAPALESPTKGPDDEGSAEVEAEDSAAADGAGANSEEAAAPEAVAAEETVPDVAPAAKSGSAVSLSDAEMDEVVELHNLLSAAANREAQHIAVNQDVWQCVYHMGSGERHFPDIKTMPSFEEFPLEEAANWSESEYDYATRIFGQQQDDAAIADFKIKLAWNLGETGKSIQREYRHRGEYGATMPKKPEGGWPILVTPLGTGGSIGKPWVAMPDGKTRELNQDEALYWAKFKKEPKLFSRPRRHAPFTNKTLHAFQRKPNKSHDLYNPPYEGTLSKRRPTTGPSAGERRRLKMRKHEAAKMLKASLEVLS